VAAGTKKMHEGTRLIEEDDSQGFVHLTWRRSNGSSEEGGMVGLFVNCGGKFLGDEPRTIRRTILEN
jgi:hypothetical protein